MFDSLLNFGKMFGSSDPESTTNVDNFAGAGENIEEKKEVAEYILEKLKESKGMLGKLKLNIFGGWIKDYLVSEGIGDTINDGMKGFFLNSVLNDKGKFTIDEKEYTSTFEFLEAAKKAITVATQADLADLRNQIQLNGSSEHPESSIETGLAAVGKGFSQNNIDLLSEQVPYKAGNCSGNVREGLDKLRTRGNTTLKIPALERAEMHGTLIRKTMGIDTQQEGEVAIQQNFEGYLDGVDFSQDNDKFKYRQQADKIKHMKGNSMVLVFTNRSPVEKRGKRHPGHASIAFRGDNGEIYVHDKSFSAGAIRNNIFKLEPYLQKLVGGYTTKSGSSKAYNLDAAMSGNISMLNNNSDNDILA